MKKQPINYNEMILRKLICVVLAFLFVHTINATDSTFLKIEKKDFYEMDSTKITFIKKQEIKLNCKLGNIEKMKIFSQHQMMVLKIKL
ncbi:MAG: hypothetical protein NTZ59_13505 [Bacteroidetes bacterium]|nr:hypothetical protein [Bacteroidota bacterium]